MPLFSHGLGTGIENRVACTRCPTRRRAGEGVPVEVNRHDIVLVGGGAAGLRAAIAAVEANPTLSVAMVSKLYPMRSHTVSAEGGAAAAVGPDDSLDLHAYDTLKGSDFLADQDTVEIFVEAAPRELVQLETLGLSLEPVPRRSGCRARLWRHERETDAIRCGQDRLPHAACPVSALHAARTDRPLRRVLRDATPGRWEPRRRSCRVRHPQRRDARGARPCGHPLHGRCRQDLPLHHERGCQDGRRHGASLSRRRRTEGYGIRAVPSDGACPERAYS